MSGLFLDSAGPRRALVLLFLLLALLTFTGIAARAEGGAWQVPWWTVDAGGGSSSGGAFRLNGTAGQPDAAPTLQGGAYTLNGGYWTVQAHGPNKLYLPLVNG